MDGYKITHEVLEMSASAAIYVRKMMAKAKASGNMALYNKWKIVLNQSGRALSLR